MVSDGKNFFVVSLVFVGWIRASSSIPTKARVQKHKSENPCRHTIHHQRLVVSNARKDVLVLVVPIDVLCDGKVSIEKQAILPLE